MTPLPAIAQAPPTVEKGARLDASISTLLIITCLLLLGGLVLLVVVRRMMRPTPGRRTRTPTSSPWRESAERMPMPESDIKEGP